MDLNFLREVNRWRLETSFVDTNPKEIIHTTLEGTKEVRSRWTTQGDEIGRGGFGKVWLQKEDGGSKRAIKAVNFRLLNESPQHKKFMLRELQLLADLKVVGPSRIST